MDGELKLRRKAGEQAEREESLCAEEFFEQELEKHLEALSANDDEVFPELEYKLQAANPKNHSRKLYRTIFDAIKRSEKRFPNMATAFNGQGIRNGKIFRRLTHGKDARYRIDLTDKDHKIPDAGLQARLEPLKNVLMIKWGMSATEDAPVLFRAEQKIKLFSSAIGSLADICALNDGKMSRLPEPFIGLFGERAGNKKLFPGVETRSDREKITIFRPALFKDRLFIVALEIAQDEGIASPVASANPADDYCIDQIEVEVKEIIDAQTGINALKHPDKISAVNGKGKAFETSERELRLKVALPVLRSEALELCREFDLAPMLDPKPKLGFDRNKVAAARKEGKARMKEARDLLISPGRSVWSDLDFGPAMAIDS